MPSPITLIPHVRRAGGVLSFGILLAGCATGPVYQAPQAVPSSTRWQAPLPHDGSSAALDDWWRQFDDPLLSRLIDQAEAESPSLAKAWANIESARATLTSSEAAALPAVTGQGSATRTRQASGSSTTRSAGADASWEIDLFGKVRRNADAARARIEARVDDWHDARVTLAAEVADTYVQYRACQRLIDAYERQLASVTRTENATQAAVRAGLNAPADATLARASVSSTRSSLVLQQGDCELLVKALVALVGGEEPALRLQLAQFAQAMPAQIPQPRALLVQAVPAEVLRQRPDLAALERELAASSAEIGAAQADLYPSLSLSGSIAVSATSGGASLTTWSLGPSLSIPLFDGGKRRAAVRSAQASYDAALANWRSGVRSVVKEVEQALVNLDTAARRADDAASADREYRRYFDSVEANARAGNVSLLTLEEARRSALTAEISLLTLQRNRVQDWIALYKALGGGWQPGAAAVAPLASQAGARGG